MPRFSKLLFLPIPPYTPLMLNSNIVLGMDELDVS